MKAPGGQTGRQAGEALTLPVKDKGHEARNAFTVAGVSL